MPDFSPHPEPLDPEADGRQMRRTYLAVIVVEVLVLLGLWWFGWYFGR